MTRVGTRPLAVLLAALLAAAVLAACGSSGSDSSSATSTEASGSTSDTTTAKSDSGPQSGGSTQSGGPQEASGGGNQDGGKNSRPSQTQQQGDDGPGGKSAAEVETPLKVSGGGSAQFRSKGGDNSIQEFGDESGESELQEAAEVVHSFYVSRAAEEWDKACSYLAKPNIEQLEQLANQSAKSRGADCATVLEAFTQPLPASVEREITTVDAGSLRHEDEQGFLIYYGAGHAKYSMPLRNEDGTWKVAALSGTALG